MPVAITTRTCGSGLHETGYICVAGVISIDEEKGANNQNILSRWVSYISTPFSRSRRSSTIGGSISVAFISFDAQMKCCDILWFRIHNGRAAGVIDHESKQFHFLERLPLVSSEKRVTGTILTSINKFPRVVWTLCLFAMLKVLICSSLMPS